MPRRMLSSYISSSKRAHNLSCICKLRYLLYPHIYIYIDTDIISIFGGNIAFLIAEYLE